MPPRKHLFLFFGVALFLCSWHLDAGHNDNTMSRALAVAALVENGSLEITAHHEFTGDKAVINDRYYSDKAPLPVFLVAPFWWLVKAGGLVIPGDHGYFNDNLLQLGGFLCGSLPLALIITLLWMRLHASAVRSPVLLATLPLFGSFLFVYSGSFYGHLLGAVFLMFALIAYERDRRSLSGVLCGAAVLCEYTLVIFPLCWAVLLLLRDRGAAWRFALGGTPAMALLLFYNWSLSGDPFSLGYEHEANYQFMDDRYGLHAPKLEAMWGLSFSAYRGLLFYMPVLVTGTIAWISLGHLNMRRLTGPVTISAILSFLIIAGYAMWWGGWAYGPRHLTAAAVLLVWRALPLIAERRWLWWPAMALSAFGFACAFLAKSTLWYSLPTGVKNPLVEEVLIRAAGGEWTHWQWPVQAGLSAGVATLLFLLIFVAAVIVLHRLDRSIKAA